MTIYYTYGPAPDVDHQNSKQYKTYQEAVDASVNAVLYEEYRNGCTSGAQVVYINQYTDEENELADYAELEVFHSGEVYTVSPLALPLSKIEAVAVLPRVWPSN